MEETFTELNQTASPSNGSSYVEHDIRNVGNLVGYPFLILAFIGIFTNFLTVSAIVKTKSLQTTANIFVASLSIIDGFYAVFIHTFHVYSMLSGSWPFGKVWCKTVALITWYAEGADFWSIVMITLNRFFAVVFPFQYYSGKFSSKAVVSTMLLTQYIVPVFTLIPVFAVVELDSHVQFSPIWSKCTVLPITVTNTVRDLTNSFNAFIPFALIVLFHIAMVKAIKTNNNRIMATSLTNPIQTQRIMTEIQLTKTATIAVVYYLVAYIPFMAIRLSHGTYHVPAAVGKTIGVIHRLAWFSNSFLYCCMNDKFRKAFKKLLCCCCKTSSTIVQRVDSRNTRNPVRCSMNTSAGASTRA